MQSPLSNSIQILRVTLIALATLALISVAASTRWTTAAAADTSKAPVPVLIELFTSEGCSSCPPADDLLARLDTQPLPGVHAIVLSEHVTYWNQDGWRDPFSLDAMTDRQRQYGSRFNLNDVYTPQAVVDGTAQMVGSNAAKLAKAIEEAASTPKAELSIQDAKWSNGAIEFSVHGYNASGTALMAALAEDSAQVSVLHGENGGRTLRHVAVVRVLKEMGKGASDGHALTLKPPASKETGPLRLVVFITDKHNGHVLAAAEQTIPRS